MNRSTRTALVVVLALLLPGVAAAQRVIYVNAAGSGAGDGTSWPDAYPHLQDALAAAESGDEIWVAEGVYRPDQGAGITPGDRQAAFVLRNGVEIYGGFDGNENAHIQREWESHRTYLSGDLLENDSNNVAPDESTRIDNSYHVVTARPGTDTTAILDGFIITSGHSNTDGGGMYIAFSEEASSSVRLRQVSFEKNVSFLCGGAIANYGKELTIYDSRFTGNVAGGSLFWCGGGAVFHYPSPRGATAQFQDTIFEGNAATQGGALSIISGRIVVKESVFLSNRSSVEGGAVHQNLVHPRWSGSEAFYINVAFLGNVTEGFGGGAISSQGSKMTVINSLFSGNKAIENDDSPSSGANGGAINVYLDTVPSESTIIQSTIAYNEARSGGGFYASQSIFTVYNSIVWGNGSDEQSKESMAIVGPGNVEVGHSLIAGGLIGSVMDLGGNLATDPLFVDPFGIDGFPGTIDDNLRLLPGSPAIDAGDLSFLPMDIFDLDQDGDTSESVPVDLDGQPRVVSGSTLQKHVDMGSYEHNSSPVSNSIEPTYRAVECPSDMLSPAYPNPFSDSTYIEYCVPGTGTAQILLMDVLGRVVRMIVHEEPRVGEQNSLNVERLDLPSGLYVIRLLGTGYGASQVIIVIR